MKEELKLIHREISWLSFNERVLQEAQDPEVPLLERIRFLGIFSNNLDEFFKVRVATIKRIIDFQPGYKRIEGEKPKKLMNMIQKKVIQLQNKFEYTYHHILGELEKKGIFLINELMLNPFQVKFVKRYFKEHVFPVLSPIILSNVDAFPYLRDKSIYLAIILRSSEPGVKTDYALIEVPTDILPRFIVLPSENEKKFIILLEDVIRYNLDQVFALLGFDQYDSWIIKLTRDAELDMDNDISKSLLELISSGIDNRKTGQPVRFVFDNSIAKDLLDYIVRKLNLDEDNNLIPGGRHHNFKDFMNFPRLDEDELLYRRDVPLGHPRIKANKSIIDTIARQDIMLHVPYHDFNIFVRLLQEASIDPRVREISITVYRVAKDSRVMNAIINAARNGKKTTAVIELQARFDEEANISWSHRLEDAGAKVIFGMPGLKVHSKLLCIGRKEGNKTRYYACVGTGNFHEENAAVYSDLFLLTGDSRIAGDVKKVFDFFENPYRNYVYRHIIKSPLHLRRKMYNLIDNEIDNIIAGKEAYIILKLNSLVDNEIIYKLYQANNAGVKIKLIIRGICSLMPGVPGLSENVEAVSIVDKYLEHSRIMIFCNNGNEKYYISSADWMTRNLDRRIEVSCPIYDRKVQKELKDIIDVQLMDNAKARIINCTQSNEYVKGNQQEKIRSQKKLYDYYKNNLQHHNVRSH
ncbi:MAG: polyphosphate kinase 1 [Bacteroidales bacterium]|nr:polyphosphate kinase 1 [Bacteroidales bacterium]